MTGDTRDPAAPIRDHVCTLLERRGRENDRRRTEAAQLEALGLRLIEHDYTPYDGRDYQEWRRIDWHTGEVLASGIIDGEPDPDRPADCVSADVLDDQDPPPVLPLAVPGLPPMLADQLGDTIAEWLE